MTVTVRPKFDWQILLSLAWIGFVAYRIFATGWRGLLASNHFFDNGAFAIVSVAAVLSLIRRERIEIYPDQMVWRKTYFGLTRSTAAPLADVVGAEWSDGQERGRDGKGPSYVEFYLPQGSVKACFGFTFEDFDQLREDIRRMYPDLITRWGHATVRSKDFTLLNLN